MLKLTLLLGLLLPLTSSAFYWEKKGVAISNQGSNWVSDWVEFEIPAGLVGFQIVVLSDRSTTVQVTDLIDPKGEYFTKSSTGALSPYSLPHIRNAASPNRSEGVANGTGTLIVPNNPKLAPITAGKWRMRTYSLHKPESAKVDVLVIGKKEAKPGTVDMKVWVAPGSYWAKKEGQVDKVLAAAKEFLEGVGVDLNVTGVEAIGIELPKGISPPDDTSAIAYKLNEADVVNAYLLGELDIQNKPVNGHACLGGPVGLPYAHGCYVSMFSSDEADQYSAKQQGLVLAHEILHYLGLFHTKTEGYDKIKVVYDSLDDTHEEPDGTNLMDPGIPNAYPSLSPLQKKMILLSPAVH
jgi:hypothetical protein